MKSLPVWLLFCVALPLSGQATRSLVVPPGASTAVAVRAVQAPVLDGREDDPVWAMSPAMDEFRQFSPAEDGEPTFRTVVRVAYDDRNLYVLVRAFDPHPDSLLSILSRRDVKTQSDQIKIIIDAYNDRRTGVEMAVNPAGVKRDASIYQDNIEDLSWDGIWDAATRVDSLGWVAEFRVPFSQLRFARGEQQVFGFGVWRDIARLNERVAWPAYSLAKQALASQLGQLQGIGAIQRSGRLELLPYVVTKNSTEPRPDGWAHPQNLTGGLDLKYGVTQNLTVDATFNPDFGQVEADPAVLNLTAFEIRFEERRPFFQEGVGLFKCQPCQGSFYTRRIGRTPQLRSSDSDPTSTTILGAAKLTGRLSRGLSVGVLDALTQHEIGTNGTTIEPQTNYFVGCSRRSGGGRSARRGGPRSIVRSTNGRNPTCDARPTRASSKDSIDSSRDHEFASWIGGGRVAGSEQAMAFTQLNPVHLYQCLDDHTEFDSTRTSLQGMFATVALSKISTGPVRRSSDERLMGEEVNDIGLSSPG
ncbi:MAG: DUF5916 domain-containing protein [Gemmatimonadaceae bacterium]